jgi:predicted DNA-binding transcriptional regulator YafY
LDGSSVAFVETLENDLAKLQEKGVDARVASGGGRMYVTMDRYEVKPSAFCFLMVSKMWLSSPLPAHA